jgi:protein-arginine kinase
MHLLRLFQPELMLSIWGEHSMEPGKMLQISNHLNWNGLSNTAMPVVSAYM